MLTSAQLITLLQDHLHNDSTYTEAKLYSYLNLGQRQIVTDAPWVLGVKEGSLTTTNGVQAYSLASDFYNMKALWDTTNSRRVFPARPSEWSEAVEAVSTVASGTPRAYMISYFDPDDEVWKMRLYPTPNGAYSLKYFYYWQPAEINGTTAGPITAMGFDQLLFWSALMLAKQRTDPSGHQEAINNYARMLNEYRAFKADGPDYVAALRSGDEEGGGPTGRLPDEFPSI